MDNMELRQIQNWRIRNNITVYAAARDCNLRQETIKNIESGKGTLQNFLRYLRYIKTRDPKFYDFLTSNI